MSVTEIGEFYVQVEDSYGAVTTTTKPATSTPTITLDITQLVYIAVYIAILLIIFNLISKRPR